MGSHLHKAKVVKNDEFYTSYEDIEKELIHYKNCFDNKIVYCNCDFDWSNFVKFFNDVKIDWNIKEVINTGSDFSNDQNLRLLKKADIVVTNPPFSLFREYVATLVKYDKTFLIMGNCGAATNRDIFPLIKNDKIWIGLNRASDFTDQEGNSVKLGNVVWYTNLFKADKRNLVLTEKYDPAKYPKYDNYDAIEVSRIRDIPCDYGGVMAVPVTLLSDWRCDIIDVVGAPQPGCHGETAPKHGYRDFWCQRQDGSLTGRGGYQTRYSPFIEMNDGKRNILTDGKKELQAVYKRVFIKLKQKD